MALSVSQAFLVGLSAGWLTCGTLEESTIKTWVPGGGVKIPCTYRIYGLKIYKKDVRKASKEAAKL